MNFKQKIRIYQKMAGLHVHVNNSLYQLRNVDFLLAILHCITPNVYAKKFVQF